VVNAGIICLLVLRKESPYWESIRDPRACKANTLLLDHCKFICKFV